ncbi:hypothetical protein LTS17_012793 [Exophiala oligosperma]
MSRSDSVPSSVATSVAPLPQQPRSAVTAKRLSTSQDHPVQSPAKKQSKWSPEEDTKIIHLRHDGMKWEDISKHLPGRSAISCRLHYQNYLERRSEWDEDRKNKLARLYERFRAEMWLKAAEEMAMPWRAVEAMHWQMGEHEMAKRAGVSPFSLSNPTGTYEPMSLSLPPRGGQLRPIGPSLRARRESIPLEESYAGSPQLPSLAELTAGLPGFSSPPYHTSNPFHHVYNNSKDRNSPFR